MNSIFMLILSFILKYEVGKWSNKNVGIFNVL